MVNNNITIEGYWRYMDDGRVFLYPIKAGCRWKDGELQYSDKWRLEDEEKSGLEITRKVIEGSMQEVMKFLRFTTEIGEGEGMWLPTLDLQIRVEVTNKISYLYYEKPTTTNVMVQKKTALDENSKHQSLSNDLIRRLGNTDENQGAEVMAKVIDNFGVKVLTSGYNITQARKITINGIRGWE